MEFKNPKIKVYYENLQSQDAQTKVFRKRR